MKNILFIAPPAAGKGTQSSLIEKEYHLPHVSTGDLLRNASVEDSELGSYIREILSSGALVRDDIIYDLLKKRITEADCQQGYILDGFPRNVEQAEKYDEMLQELKQQLGYVIVLEIPENILAKRVTGRRICENCGAVYNLNTETEQPQQESTCDRCQGRLLQRNDDNIESFRHRYQVYMEKTKPLLDYYRQKGVLYVINGEGTVEEVHQRILAVLKGEAKHD